MSDLMSHLIFFFFFFFVLFFFCFFFLVALFQGLSLSLAALSLMTCFQRRRRGQTTGCTDATPLTRPRLPSRRSSHSFTDLMSLKRPPKLPRPPVSSGRCRPTNNRQCHSHNPVQPWETTTTTALQSGHCLSTKNKKQQQQPLHYGLRLLAGLHGMG